MLAAQSSAAPFSRFDFYCERLGVDFEQLDEGEKNKLNECFAEGADCVHHYREQSESSLNEHLERTNKSKNAIL